MPKIFQKVPRVQALWNLWEEFANQQSARKNTSSPDKIMALDESLAWDTGAGKTSKHHLALSSEGDPERRVLVERILSRGPGPSEVWEFYSAKQRVHDPIWKVALDGLVVDYALMQIEVEPDEMWRRLDVCLCHPELRELDADRRNVIAILFLDMVLGEDEVEKWVGR